MALMAKETTAARAAMRRMTGLRLKTSAATAAMANRTPRTLRASSPRAGVDLGEDA